MGGYFYSVARVDAPSTGVEYGWRVMRHDGKQIIPVSEIFLSSAEAVLVAESFVAGQKETDA